MTGRVLFEGDVPKLEPLEVGARSSEGCCPAGQQVDRTNPTLLLSEDGGIANVVVTIDVEGAEVTVPEAPLVMANHLCQFEPHVIVAPVGATVEFTNGDEAPHNIHTYPLKGASLNRTITKGTATRTILERTDRIRVTCDLHPWMEGWIFVTDTPFHALTDDHGAFRIEGLPPGEHPATLWHERLGKQKATVVVQADGEISVEWRMSAKKRKKKGHS